MNVSPQTSLAIKAFANCDHAFVVWQTVQPIPDCLGFALERRRNGKEPAEFVQTWVGFAGSTATPGTHRPSNVWPLQKFMWSDYLVEEKEQISGVCSRRRELPERP